MSRRAPSTAQSEAGHSDLVKDDALRQVQELYSSASSNLGGSGTFDTDFREHDPIDGALRIPAVVDSAYTIYPGWMAGSVVTDPHNQHLAYGSWSNAFSNLDNGETTPMQEPVIDACTTFYSGYDTDRNSRDPQSSVW
jgi:hypothetical protein